MTEQHVVPYKGKWATRGAGNKKVTKIHDIKKDAVHFARNIAKNQKTELVIHKKDGIIQDKDSYGNDTMPPRDRRH